MQIYLLIFGFVYNEKPTGYMAFSSSEAGVQFLEENGFKPDPDFPDLFEKEMPDSPWLWARFHYKTLTIHGMEDA